jgi:GTP-binding protein
LVINKIDLLPEDDLEVAKDLLLTELDWSGPLFLVSAETGAGTDALGQAVMRELELLDEAEDAAEM